MAYTHGGLQGSPPAVPDLVPREAGIRLNLERLPVESLLQAGVTAALEYMFFGEVGAEGDVLNELRLSLTEARTELRISDGRFEGPRLLLTLAGLLSADAQALWGLSGSIDLSVRGLDALLQTLQAGAPPAPANPQRPSFADQLRAFGQLAADGQTYHYKFEVNQQGQLLINGQDAGPLFAAFFAG
jgi:hypothetical protein